MAGLDANALEREGYVLQEAVDAALPMPVWAVDFEVERQRSITAAELAVLKLIEQGIGDLGRLTKLLGLGEDVRLVEGVLVKLLGAGAVEPKGDELVITQVGTRWKQEGRMTQRERVTFDVRLDPMRRAFEWLGDERPIFATEDTWTIELPPASDRELLMRKHEVGKLIRETGLPDDEDRPRGERRPEADLVALAIVSRRTHWRPARVDVWRHPSRDEVKLIGHVNDAEHPPLSELLQGRVLDAKRKRIRPALAE